MFLSDMTSSSVSDEQQQAEPGVQKPERGSSRSKPLKICGVYSL